MTTKYSDLQWQYLYEQNTMQNLVYIHTKGHTPNQNTKIKRGKNNISLYIDHIIIVTFWNKIMGNCCIFVETCSSRKMSSSGLQTIPRKDLFREGENVTLFCSHELTGRNYSSICSGLNTWEPPLPTCPRMYIIM